MKYSNSDFFKEKGIIRAKDLSDRDIPRYKLTELVNSGVLEHVTKGVYRKSDHEFGVHHDMAIAMKLMPKGVICLLSALNFHELGTQYADGVWVGLPNKARTPQVDYPVIHRMYFSDTAMKKYVEVHEVEGVKCRIASAARTVAECFKYRNKIGLDVALEALNEFWRYRKERGYTMNDLTKAATMLRVKKVMSPYLEMMVS